MVINTAIVVHNTLTTQMNFRNGRHDFVMGITGYFRRILSEGLRLYSA